MHDGQLVKHRTVTENSSKRRFPIPLIDLFSDSSYLCAMKYRLIIAIIFTLNFSCSSIAATVTHQSPKTESSWLYSRYGFSTMTCLFACNLFLNAAEKVARQGEFERAAWYRKSALWSLAAAVVPNLIFVVQNQEVLLGKDL